MFVLLGSLCQFLLLYVHMNGFCFNQVLVINSKIFRENLVYFGSCGLIVVPIQHEAPVRPGFNLLSLCWKNKTRLMRSPCCLDVCVSLMPEPIFMILVYVSWLLSPCQRRISYIPAINQSIGICRPHRQKRYRGNEYRRNNTRTVGSIVFYTVDVVSKASRRLVLPGISC
jgi:hypothetical protein